MAGEDTLEGAVGERERKRVGLDEPEAWAALRGELEHRCTLVEPGHLAAQVPGQEARAARDVERPRRLEPGERREQRLALTLPVRPVALLEQAPAEPPVVVLRRAGLVVRLHPRTVRPVLEAVPNFSEGRDEAVLDELRAASVDARATARRARRRRPPPLRVHPRRRAGRARRDAARGDRLRARPDRPAPARGRASAHRRRRRRPRGADQAGRHGARDRDGAHARASRSARSSTCRCSSTASSRPAGGLRSSGRAAPQSCNGGSTRASSSPTSARRASTSGREA